MVTRYTVVQDGQVYEPGDDVPDMGSITALESKGIFFMQVALALAVLENITRAVISGMACMRAFVTCIAGTGLTGRSGLACRPIKKLLVDC